MGNLLFAIDLGIIDATDTGESLSTNSHEGCAGAGPLFVDRLWASWENTGAVRPKADTRTSQTDGVPI